jgi:hypothetical protein
MIIVTYTYRQLAQLYKDMALTASSGTTASTANTKGLLQLGGLAGILKNLVPGSAGGKKQKHLKKVKEYIFWPKNIFCGSILSGFSTQTFLRAFDIVHVVCIVYALIVQAKCVAE